MSFDYKKFLRKEKVIDFLNEFEGKIKPISISAMGSGYAVWYEEIETKEVEIKKVAKKKGAKK